MKPIGDEGRLLTRFTGQDYHPDLRPLAWIDLDSLEEEKLKGLEECELFVSINHYENRKGYRECLHVSLGENRLLIISPFTASIFDFSEGKLIASLNTDFEDTKFAQKGLEGEIYVTSDQKVLKLLRTKRLKNGKTIVQKSKLFHLHLYLKGVHPLQVENKPRIVQLQTGNYLLEIELNFDKREKSGSISAESDLVYLEIDGKTLEQLSWRIKKEIKALERVEEIQQIYTLSNYLIFAAELKDKNQGQSEDEDDEFFYFQRQCHSNLILAALDFEILDYCETATLKFAKAVRAIKSNRVILIGEEDDIYLHKVDFARKKLILLKSMRVDSGRFSFDSIVSPIPSVFCCQIIPSHKKDRPGSVWNGYKTQDSELKYKSFVYNSGRETLGYEPKYKHFVVFDWDLKPSCYMKIQAQRLIQIYPKERFLSAQIKNKNYFKGDSADFCLVDTEKGNFKTARVPRLQNDQIEYQVDKTSGMAHLVHRNERSILKVSLN